jgi:HEAT repeat protein
LTALPGELNQPKPRRENPRSGWEGEAFEDSSIAVTIAAIHHGTVSERRAAAISLIFKEISEDELPAVIEALVEALKQREVRFPVLRAISALGPKASGAMKAIKEHLKAKDPMVRCATLLALESIGSDTVDALASGLEDPFLMNTALAAECLARMGPDAASALPALKAASQSPNEAVRNKILSSIETIRQGKN